MATATHDLRHALARRKEIDISVIGRKSGKWISRPVWFVLEDDTVYLLPVEGADTQWYKNLLRHPKIRISAGDVEGEFSATHTTDQKTVTSVVEKFRSKYGAADIKKYYSKLDVAVLVKIA
jgi:deazaflavin-dependent oxidoreductase (nitroreductase family)